MIRHLLMLRVTVKDGERAFLTRNGRFERVLEPGRHRLFDPLRRADGRTASGRAHRVSRRTLRRAQGGAAGSRGRDVRGGGDAGGRGRHREPRRPACRIWWRRGRRACSGRSRPASMSSASTWRATRRSRRAISRCSARERNALRGRDRGREPRGGPALCRGPARRAARAGPARLLDGRPQGRGQAPRSAAAGGRDHRAGDADQGPHLAARDAHRAAPDRRSGAGRGRDRGRGRLALPAGAVRDPRGGRRRARSTRCSRRRARSTRSFAPMCASASRRAASR